MPDINRIKPLGTEPEEEVVYLRTCQTCGYDWIPSYPMEVCPELRNHPYIVFWKERK